MPHRPGEVGQGPRQVAETVTGHIPSDQMYRAMYAEVRELAQTVVTHMDPEHREALLGAARTKFREARPRRKTGKGIKGRNALTAAATTANNRRQQG